MDMHFLLLVSPSMQLLLLLLMSGLLILEHLIIWLRINPYFFVLNECNTKKIFVGDDRYLSVVVSGTIHVYNGHFNDVLCVPSLSCNLLSVYQITHLGEGKTVEFSPHQVVIKDLKDPKHVLAIGIVNDITRFYNFYNFGTSYFPSFFVAHSDDLSKLWHDQFGHLNYRSLQQLCN
jgi:hypothetical protein